MIWLVMIWIVVIAIMIGSFLWRKQKFDREWMRDDRVEIAKMFREWHEFQAEEMMKWIEKPIKFERHL